MYKKLFFNANIIGADETHAAMLVCGQKITAVGTYRYCLGQADSGTLEIDCKGNTIVPGLIDSHCHLVEAGETLQQPDLKGYAISSVLNMLQAVSKSEASPYPVIAMGLDDNQFNELRLLERSPRLGERGFLLFHSSGHCALADSRASKIIHRQTSNGGTVVIDEPYEDPHILDVLQNRKHHEPRLEKCVRSGIRMYLAHGITSLQDNTWDPEVFRFMSQMVRGIDITGWAKGDDVLSAWTFGSGVQTPENVSKGPVKFFIDGAFYNKTAWLHGPYSGAGDWCGKGLNADELARRISPFISQKQQCIFHAAGDRAISELCTALESLLPHFPWIPELRIRIEHAQLIHERDYERIRNLGMVISCQPRACGNPERDVELLGEKRAKQAYPHRRILDEGIPFALGSDFPYEESMDPFRGISCVTNRRIGESLESREALKAYTHGSAYANFEEDRKGVIAEGLQADFFITEENPLGKIARGKQAIESVYSRGFCVHEKSYV